MASMIIGLSSVGYGMVFEIFFSDRLKLYYYINPKISTFYIIIASIFIYPFLNMMYTMFLPKSNIKILVYTGTWIIGMLILEYLTLIFGVIVFTGWRMFPWSVITYIITYVLIYPFYRFLRIRNY